jgi:hypothetical protein
MFAQLIVGVLAVSSRITALPLGELTEIGKRTGDHLHWVERAGARAVDRQPTVRATGDPAAGGPAFHRALASRTRLSRPHVWPFSA